MLSVQVDKEPGGRTSSKALKR